MSARSLYELLDTRPEASPAELRHDYERALASANRSGATKHMVTLVEAYEVLSDPHRRAKYDATGRAVPPQHIGNPYGRAVPFRSDLPGLGQGARRGASGATVIPTRSSLRPRRPLLVGLLVGSVLGIAVGAGAIVASQRPAQPVGRLVPGLAGRTQTQVICPKTTFWSLAGRSVTCPDGAEPTWGAVRTR